MWVGIATTNLCLGSAVMPSSLFQKVLAALQFSHGGVSPVRMMKDTCAALAMVTSLSWMVNARTSSVIVRIPARIRNGLTSRSVGSNNMLPPVPFLRTGVACCLPTCERGFSLSGTELVGKVVLGLFGFFLVLFASWRC